MANSIELAKVYVPTLDAAYKLASITAPLENDTGTTWAGLAANEIKIPKITMDGLGAYDKALGHTLGSVTSAWETHTLGQDRGRTFKIDAVDNMTSFDTLFSQQANEFIRTKVVPEVDAYRFSAIATKAGTTVTTTIDASSVLGAFDAAIETAMNNEVDLTDTIWYMSPSTYKFAKQANRTIYNNVLGYETLDGIQIVQVPQSRFYKGITLQDGKTSGQEAGGYVKTVSTGKDIRFMLVSRSSVIPVMKLEAPQLFVPGQVAGFNGYQFDYRMYHDCFVPDNKVKGIYACIEA